MTAWNAWLPLPRPRDNTTTAVPRVRPEPAPPPDCPDGPRLIDRPTSTTATVQFVLTIPGATAAALLVGGWLNPDDPTACDLYRVPGTDRWSATFEVPGDWQVSYRIALHRGTDQPSWHSEGLRSVGATAIPDPANPARHTATRGAISSVLRLPGAGSRPWLQPPAPQTTSNMSPVRLPLPSGSPDVWSWAPDRPADDLPTVVLFDGRAHVEGLGTHHVIQSAITAGVLPPLMLIMVDSGDRRAEVLGVPGGVVEFVGTELMPYLRETGLPDGRTASEDPSRVVVSGSSFGGLSALFTLARFSDSIGAAVAQSTSLWRYAPGSFEAIASRFRGTTVRLQAGNFEGRMVEHSQHLAAVMSACDVDVECRAVSGGHDWAWWLPEMVTGIAEILDG